MVNRLFIRFVIYGSLKFPLYGKFYSGNFPQPEISPREKLTPNKGHPTG